MYTDKFRLDLEDVEYSADKFLMDLRVEIPFLSEIPDEIYLQLDTSEFYMPRGIIGEARLFLENVIQQNVMTYKAGTFNLEVPVARYLCANLKPAALDSGQLQLLQDMEDGLRREGYNISFSAYQKPLELISPYEGPMFEFYVSKGLRI